MPVFFCVNLARMLFMLSGVARVASRGVRMMRRFLMLTAFVMASRFGMMTGGVGVMFRSLLVVFDSFLGHCKCLLLLRLPHL